MYFLLQFGRNFDQNEAINDLGAHSKCSYDSDQIREVPDICGGAL